MALRAVRAMMTEGEAEGEELKALVFSSFTRFLDLLQELFEREVIPQYDRT